MNLLQRIVELSQPLEPNPTGAEPVLPTLSDIRAVLFDIYGTLIISGSGDVGVAMAQDNAAAFTAALNAMNLAANVPDGQAGVARLHEIITQHHARRRDEGVEYPEVDIREVWAELFDTPPDRDTLEALSIEYECRVNPTWPMPDLVDTLDALHGKDLTLGIISNAQFFTPLLFPAYTDRTLEDFGFTDELCIYSYELLEAKPSTAMYEQAAERLRDHHGILPRQVLYVGNDMLNDITPATQVGFKTALFAGDKRSLRRREDDPRTKGVSPDATLTSLADLPRLLS